MSIFNLFKRYCPVFLILVLAACSGGGGNGDDDDDNTPATSPNISLSESNHDFPGTVLGNSADYTFTITNNGTGNLAIGQITASTLPFSIVDDTCSNETVAANGTCSLKARFSPAAQGADQLGALSIPSNDADQATAIIDLSGEGYGLSVWINAIDASDCDNISLDVTVTDPVSGNPITDLTTDDFTLTYQNGTSQPQNITNSFNVDSGPVTVVLAIDWSNSTGGVLSEITGAASSFVGELTDQDQGAVCKFNGAIEFSPTLSGFYAGDSPDLPDAIINPFAVTNGTKFYDAVYQSIERVKTDITGNQPAVIVISDGVDEGSSDGTIQPSTHTLDEVINYAIAEQVPIFSIYYDSPDWPGPGRSDYMQALGEETGGQFYIGVTPQDLDDIYMQISSVLGNKYTITFQSDVCSGTVLLDLMATNPDNGDYGHDSKSITFP